MLDITDRASQAHHAAADEERKLIQEHPDKSLVSIQVPAGLAARLDALLDRLWRYAPEWANRSRDDLVADVLQHRLCSLAGADAYVAEMEQLKSLKAQAGHYLPRSDPQA